MYDLHVSLYYFVSGHFSVVSLRRIWIIKVLMKFFLVINIHMYIAYTIIINIGSVSIVANYVATVYTGYFSCGECKFGKVCKYFAFM